MSEPVRFGHLARAGYATRGVVYLIVGVLAAISTVGGGDVSSQSAIETLLRQPFGQILIWLVAAGLAFFVLWRLIQGVLNTDHQPNNFKGIATRVGLLVSAVTYAALALFAAQRALNLASSSGSGASSGGWTQWLLQQPFGRYLLGIAGLIVIGVGIAHISKGFNKGYAKYLDQRARGNTMIETICSYGLAARGALFVIVGGLIAWGAFTYQGNRNAGLSDALSWLQGQPFGQVLYGLAALGLVAFGIYGLIEARYRRIKGPSMAEARTAV